MSKHFEENYRLEMLVDQLDPNGEPQVGWVYRAAQHIKTTGRKLGIFSGSFNRLLLHTSR